MFELVFENNLFCIISKHPEVDFHGSGFVESIKESLACELYPVHRLDKVTSGLLVFAKSSEVARLLSEEFQAHRIRKLYLALSDKKPKKKQGLVKGDMDKSRRGTYKLLRSQENPAITRFNSTSLAEGIRLYLLYPQTGRTHQLRVMMKSVGAPILGDTSYGGSSSDRVYLHAYELKFSLHGQEYFFTDLPKFGELFATNNLVNCIDQLKTN